MNKQRPELHQSHGFVVPTELPSAVFKTMQTPTPLLKYGKSGSPHFRNFYLADDKSKLIWHSENKVNKKASTESNPYRLTT
jgi:hypothetical protein